MTSSELDQGVPNARKGLSDTYRVVAYFPDNGQVVTLSSHEALPEALYRYGAEEGFKRGQGSASYEVQLQSWSICFDEQPLRFQWIERTFDFTE